MGHDTPLSAGTDVIVDTNVFFAIGQPDNPRYRKFRQAIQTAGVICKLPKRVISELGGSETDRVQTALTEGWAEMIDPPSLTDGDAVAASDIARRTIASETGRPEHEIEKADVLLAGIAVQYARDRSRVAVLTDDKPARAGIKSAVSALGHEEKITVYGVTDIIGNDSGDSVKLI
ncbi:hypothetical protein [Halocatena salina]|uniref:PIN domain-containing protein n=1 Tax=Halocatena salina TaxID=2934340 RepID=A0A8U0AB59_9EURY|nr:hypothetical protein [Halocatena salina]UPM45007.1 hypothetical protein MW046_18290 [Halocatena salina]